jgi:hypothetical protein
MQAQDIEIHLVDLGQELCNMGVSSPIRILMVGGAFMIRPFWIPAPSGVGGKKAVHRQDSTLHFQTHSIC